MADEFYFDEHAAQLAERFFERLLHHTIGEWVGQKFILEDWQRDQIIRPLWARRENRGL